MSRPRMPRPADPRPWRPRVCSGCPFWFRSPIPLDLPAYCDVCADVRAAHGLVND